LVQDFAHVDLVVPSQHTKAANMKHIAASAADRPTQMDFLRGLQGAAGAATRGLANAAEAKGHAMPVDGFASLRVGEHLSHLAADTQYHPCHFASALRSPQQRRIWRPSDVRPIQLQGALLAAARQKAALA
jgi:hypothetical protein